MRELYGVSAAFYGDNPRRLTTALLSGDQKDNIRVQRRADYVLDGDEADPVGAAVLNLLWDVGLAVRNQSQNGRSFRIPVIYGGATGFNPTGLVEPLCFSYRPLLDGLLPQLELAKPKRNWKTRGLPDSLLRSGETDRLQRELLYAGMFMLLTDENESNLFPEYRTYVPAEQQGLRLGKDESTRLIVDAVGRELRSQFDRQLETVLAGHTTVKPELDETVREIARSLADLYKIQLGDTPLVSRFISAATTDDTSSDGDVRNVIFPRLDLRQIYAAAFMDHLGINHNVCFKCSLDPRSPPFADITAAHMADSMDKRDKTKPGAIMVQHN